MGKFIQRSLETVRVVEQDVVAAPQAVTTFVEQKIADPVISSAKTIVETVVQYVDREVQVIKEVPVTVEKEVIKFVDREVKVLVEVPKYITQEVEKIVHVPVDSARYVEKEVVKFIHKAPYWMWMALALETLTVIILIIK